MKTVESDPGLVGRSLFSKLFSPPAPHSQDTAQLDCGLIDFD